MSCSDGFLSVVGNAPLLTFIDPVELTVFYSSEFFTASRCRSLTLSSSHGNPEVIVTTIKSPDYRFAIIDPVPPSTRTPSWTHLDRYLGRHHQRARDVFGIAHVPPNSSFGSDHIITGSFGGSRVELWDLKDPKGRLKGVCENVNTDIWCIKYAHSWNDSMFSCGFGGRDSDAIRQHSATRLGQPIAIYKNHTAQVCGLQILEGKHILLSASDDKTVNVWDVRTATRSGRLISTTDSDGIFCLEVFKENDNMILIGQRQGRISMLDRRKADANPVVDSVCVDGERIIWEFAGFESPVFGPCHAVVGERHIAIVAGFPSRLKLARVSETGVVQGIPAMYSICAYGFDSGNSRRLAEEENERLGFLLEYQETNSCAVRLRVFGVGDFLVCRALVTVRWEQEIE